MDKVKFNDKEIPLLEDFINIGLGVDNAIKEIVSTLITDRDIVVKGMTVTQTSPAGLSVSVNVDGTSGYGMALRSNGDIIKIDSNQTVSIAENTSGLTRIDTIIAKEDHEDADQEYRYFRTSSTGIANSLTYTAETMVASISVVEGTPGSGVAPDTTTGYIKLAEVTVVNGAASIVNANIKDVSNSNSWTTEPSTVHNEEKVGNFKQFISGTSYLWQYGTSLSKSTIMSLSSTGNLTIQGNLTVVGNISGSMATAAITTANITTANIGTLNVTSNSLLSGTLGVADQLSATKASGTGLAVTANATIGGTLGVTGATTLGTATITTANITNATISSLTASKVVGTNGSKGLTSSVTTDGLSEGSTNLYFTNARAVAAVSTGTISMASISLSGSIKIENTASVTNSFKSSDVDGYSIVQSASSDDAIIRLLKYGPSATGTYVTGINKAGLSVLDSSGSALLIAQSIDRTIYFATNGAVQADISSLGLDVVNGISSGGSSKIKWKTYSGTLSSDINSGKFAHGLGSATIVGVHIVINNGTSWGTMAGNNDRIGVYFDSTYVQALGTETGSKSYRAVIFYL